MKPDNRRPQRPSQAVFPIWKAVVVVLAIFGIALLFLSPKKQGNDELQKLVAEFPKSSERVPEQETNQPQSRSGYRVMADYGSSGIWRIQTVGPFRHVMVTHESLSLPAELSERFKKWISMYDDRSADQELKNIDKFNTFGIELAKDLKKFLGKKEYVEYQGDAPHDEILAPVPIE